MRSSQEIGGGHSGSPRDRRGHITEGRQLAPGGGASNSRYTEIHAFHKKRTLASGFFNAQQVTQASNKQFSSKPRRPANRKGEATEAAGKTALSGFTGSSPRRGGNPKHRQPARDGATQAMLVTTSSQGSPGHAPFGSPGRGAGLGALGTS